MDDRQFDNAVRSLSRHRSRRALLGSLLGGSLALLATRFRVPGAFARQGYRVQGEPCTDDSQCIGAEILYCAYNGFGSAGAACCAPNGGSCVDEAGCCGPATCYRGHCWDFSAPSLGEWCGDHACESWQRCCSQCSGICAPRDAVCGEGQCRSGYTCPDDCGADSWCAGCLSGYCLSDGACA